MIRYQADVSPYLVCVLAAFAFSSCSGGRDTDRSPKIGQEHLRSSRPPADNLAATVNPADETEKIERWLKAAAHGDIGAMTAMLSAGLDVNTTDANGWTAMHVVALKNRPEVAEFLLRNHASVEATDVDGWTPLHVASLNGSTAVVRWLLSRRVEVDAGDEEGWTALHAAVHNNHADIVDLLLTAGADVDAASEEGNTALHFAMMRQARECEMVLRARGADIEISNNEGKTADEMSQPP